MRYRLTAAGRITTSADAATWVFGDREGRARFPWPHRRTNRSCRERPLHSDYGQGNEVTMPRYRHTFVAAATSPHVELAAHHGKLSGTGLRGHKRSHGAHPHQGADAGAPRVAGPRPASASPRPASLRAAGRRNPQLLCSVIAIGRRRLVASAAYPLGRHLVANNSGGRC